MRGMANFQGTLTGVAGVCVGSVAAWPSGREWNGSQPGQGASERGQRRGRCRVRRRAESVPPERRPAA